MGRRTEDMDTIAEGYRTRVEALEGRDGGVDEEVAGLLAMLAEADDEDGPLADLDAPEDLRRALAPVLDRLVGMGPASVAAVVSTHSPADVPSSGLVAEALYRIAASGPGEGCVVEIAAYLLANALGSSMAFHDRAVRAVPRAGAAVEPLLLDLLRTAEDPHSAALLVRSVLEDSDPAWAGEASHRMLTTLLDEGHDGLADLLSPGVATVCGGPALPTIQEVARRKAAGGYDKTLLFQADVYDALEMLGDDPRAYGLDPYDPITRHFNTLMFGPDESKWGTEGARCPENGEEGGGLPPLDLTALRRHDRADLAAWCEEFGLGTGGSKDELVERLGSHLEEEFPVVEPLSGVEVGLMRPKRLRELLDRYGIVTHGGRGELVERLRWVFDNFRRDVGPPPVAARGSLEASELPVLVDLCRVWDLDPRGGPDELVDRILEAQDAHAEGRRPWPPGGSGEGIIPPGTFEEEGGTSDR